jgi:acyl-CoA thioester hydrolase
MSAPRLVFRRLLGENVGVWVAAAKHAAVPAGNRCGDRRVPAEFNPPRPLFETAVAVRWADQDMVGHVNNVIFLRYMEEARLQWFNSLQLAPGDTDERAVVVSIGASLLKSIIYPATLRVTVALAAVGNRSITISHRLFDAADAEVLYAEGFAKVVWTDPATSRSVPLPASVLRGLGLEV